MKKFHQIKINAKNSSTLSDKAIQITHLKQSGIPSGENGHRILNVSPVLAEAVIRAHIENKRAELGLYQERARIELEGGAP